MKSLHDCIELTRAGAGSGAGNAYYDFHTMLLYLPDREDSKGQPNRAVKHHEWTHWLQHSTTTIGNYIFSLRHRTDGFVDMFWKSCPPSQYRSIVMERLQGHTSSLLSYEAQVPNVRPEISARLGDYKKNSIASIGFNQFVDVGFIHYDPEAGISSQRLCEDVAFELCAATYSDWGGRPGYEDLLKKFDAPFRATLAERLHRTLLTPVIHGELITLQAIFESVAVVVEMVAAQGETAEEVLNQRLESLASSWYCAPLRAYCRELGLALTPQTLYEQAETFLALCEVAMNPQLPPRVPLTLQGLDSSEVFPAQRFVMGLAAIRAVGRLECSPGTAWVDTVHKYYVYCLGLAQAARLRFLHRFEVPPLIPPQKTAQLDRMLFEVFNGAITQSTDPSAIVSKHWSGVSDWELRYYLFDLAYAMLRRTGVGFVGDSALAFKTRRAGELTERFDRVNRRFTTRQPLTPQEFIAIRNEVAWYPPVRFDGHGKLRCMGVWPPLMAYFFVLRACQRFFESDLLFSRAVPRMNAVFPQIDGSYLKIFLEAREGVKR